MIRGLYISASGMLASQHSNDIVADNLANVNTPGYKKDSAVTKTFAQELLTRLESGDSGSINNNSAALGVGDLGIVVDRVTTGFGNGPLVQTDNPTDLALNGPGFFTVATPDGLKYTRSGNFQLDGSGNLVTAQGYLVMGSNGPVSGLSSNDFTVAANGTIQQGGQTIDRLAITDFPPNSLRKVGDNLFTSENPGSLITAVDVKQKFLEQSNVDVASEMADMMTALRSYEANQKVIQTMDSTLDKAVNDIGKI